jgi:methionyl aminopeptidase
MSISSPEQFARLCVSLDKVGWTYHTADGGLSVHYEHTVVITRAEPVLLTAA